MLLYNIDAILPASKFEALKRLEASSNWIAKYMKHNKFTRKRSVGNECFLSAENLQDYCILLKKLFGMWPIENLCNRNEVAVLYHFLSGRYVHELDGSYSFFHVSYRLTVVLIVFLMF